jgi:hypothetical protein
MGVAGSWGAVWRLVGHIDRGGVLLVFQAPLLDLHGRKIDLEAILEEVVNSPLHLLAVAGKVTHADMTREDVAPGSQAPGMDVVHVRHIIPHYVHPLDGERCDRCERLDDRLTGVATAAGRRGDKVGARNAALAAGLLHDLGNYGADFQRLPREFRR